MRAGFKRENERKKLSRIRRSGEGFFGKKVPKKPRPFAIKGLRPAGGILPAGKRAETLEAIRKLTGELSVTLSEEQPDLDLRLAADGRASLLERLKALGKLTETPIVMTKAKREVAKPNPAGRGDAFAGGRSGGGGGAFAGGGLGGSAEFRINKPPLRLTLILKELPPEEPQ